MLGWTLGEAGCWFVCWWAGVEVWRRLARSSFTLRVCWFGDAGVLVSLGLFLVVKDLGWGIPEAELEARDAGAVDCGLLYLLKFRFLGIPAEWPSQRSRVEARW